MSELMFEIRRAYPGRQMENARCCLVLTSNRFANVGVSGTPSLLVDLAAQRYEPTQNWDPRKWNSPSPCFESRFSYVPLNSISATLFVRAFQNKQNFHLATDSFTFAIRLN